MRFEKLSNHFPPRVMQLLCSRAGIRLGLFDFETCILNLCAMLLKYSYLNGGQLITFYWNNYHGKLCLRDQVLLCRTMLVTSHRVSRTAYSNSVAYPCPSFPRFSDTGWELVNCTKHGWRSQIWSTPIVLSSCWVNNDHYLLDISAMTTEICRLNAND